MGRLRVFFKVFFVCIGITVAIGVCIASILWAATIAHDVFEALGVFGPIGACVVFLITLCLVIALIAAFAPLT